MSAAPARAFEPADRLKQLPPYLFVEIDKAKRRLRADGKDVIDLGIGDPDQPTPKHIIEALRKAAGDPENHQYPSYSGMTRFRGAAAGWMKRRFGVGVDAETEVVSLIGSKEGIANFPLAFVNPGDVVLIPSPGYPPYNTGALFAGGQPYFMPLKRENRFLPDLDAIRLEILKRIYPAAGDGARPVDLFDTDRHEVFALKIQKPFGEWTVVGIFNISEKEAAERVLPLERLWLDPQKRYVAYDFWNERLHGEVERSLRVRVPPASVVLLALHQKRGIPQVISTDRHVLQGAVELENVRWSPDTRTLEGVSLGPVGTAHNVAVYVPEPHPWIQGGPFLFHDFPGYTLKMMDDHLLRVRVRFDHGGRVEWRIAFDDFFGRR